MRAIELQRSSSWLSIVVMAALLIGAQALAIHARAAADIPFERRLVLGGVAAAVLVVAVWFRREWTRRIATLLFLVLVTPYYVVAWLMHAIAASGTTPWVPFELFRHYVLFLAVLIPGAWQLNALLMAGFAIEAVLIWTVLDLSNVPSAVTRLEPWSTMVYVIVAAALLAFRVSHDRKTRELERARSRAEMLENVARVFLGIRDRANTPLQTLRLTAELLRRNHPDATELADKVSRSTDTIADMSALLTRFESKVESPSEDVMTDEEILRAIDEA